MPVTEPDKKSDLELVLAIVQQANTALFTLNEMGMRFTGLLDIPILLKAFKIIP